MGTGCPCAGSTTVVTTASSLVVVVAWLSGVVVAWVTAVVGVVVVAVGDRCGRRVVVALWPCRLGAVVAAVGVVVVVVAVVVVEVVEAAPPDGGPTCTFGVPDSPGKTGPAASPSS